MSRAKILIIAAFFSALGFGPTLQAAPPAIGPIVVTAVYHDSQAIAINLGADADLEYSVFTLPESGQLFDANHEAITDVPYAAPRDSFGRAVVYYLHAGDINPDFFVYMAQRGAEFDRAMVRVNVSIVERNEIYAQDPTANPSAQPLATANGFNQAQTVQVDTTRLRNSGGPNDFVSVWIKAVDSSLTSRVTRGLFLVDNSPPSLISGGGPGDVNPPDIVPEELPPVCVSGKRAVQFTFGASDNLGLKAIRVKVRNAGTGNSHMFYQPVKGSPAPTQQTITIVYDPTVPFQHEGEYQFEFKAVDSVDLISGDARSHVQNLNFDSLPPSAVFLEPLNDQVISNHGFRVKLNLSDAGCGEVSLARLNYPAAVGASIVRENVVLDLKHPEYLWVTDQLPSGNYDLLATAVDGVGNQVTDVKTTPTVLNAGSLPPEARIVIQEGDAVGEGRWVHLDGTLSADPFGQGLIYEWIQTAGPGVGDLGRDAVVTFKTPSVHEDTSLGFSLVVTDKRGVKSRAAAAVLNVHNDVDIAISVAQPLTHDGTAGHIFPLEVAFPGAGGLISNIVVQVTDDQGRVVDSLTCAPEAGVNSCLWNASPTGTQYQNGSYEIVTIVDLGDGGDTEDLIFRQTVVLEMNPVRIDIPGIKEGGFISGPINIQTDVPAGTAQFTVKIDGNLVPAQDLDPAGIITGHVYTWDPQAPVNDPGKYEGPHSIELSAIDVNGAVIGTDVLNIFRDNQPPSLSLLSPTPAEMNDEGLYLRATFIVESIDPRTNPTDPNGVDTVQMAFIGMAPDGSNLIVSKRAHSTNLYSFDLDTQNYPDSHSTFPPIDYQCVVTVTDLAGNSRQQSFTFIIDNSNPPQIGDVDATPRPAYDGFVLEDGEAAISLQFNNVSIDLTTDPDTALIVNAKQNGVWSAARLPGEVDIIGNTVHFRGNVPANSEVRWSVEVKVKGALGTGVYRRTFQFIRGMKKSAGGTVLSADGKISLKVYPGSLSEDAYVRVEKYGEEEAIVGRANAEARDQGLNIYAGPYKIYGTNARGLEVDPILRTASALSFVEPMSELPVDEQHRVIKLHELDDRDGIWRPLGTESIASSQSQEDPIGVRAVSVPITRFGVFQVVSELIPQEGISEFFNYPNPFNPHEGPTHFRYLLGEESHLTFVIYDLFGNLVKKFEVPAGGTGGRAGLNEVAWSGCNGEGSVVGNGGYAVFVQVKGVSGKKYRIKHKVGVLK